MGQGQGSARIFKQGQLLEAMKQVGGVRSRERRSGRCGGGELLGVLLLALLRPHNPPTIQPLTFAGTPLLLLLEKKCVLFMRCSVPSSLKLERYSNSLLLCPCGDLEHDKGFFR